MPSVCFGFRFIVDKDFFDKVMKKHRKLFLCMMYISNCSNEHKRKHNLMSERIRNEIIKENPNYSPEYIKSSLNKINEPEEIESIDDEIIRNIKYAVHYTRVSSKKVTPICILTSDEKKEKYLESPHLQDVTNVIVKSGYEAIALLKNYKQSAWER